MIAITDSQALAEYVGTSLAGINRFAAAVGVGVRRLADFAADNMLMVAILVAVLGFLLLRPRHSPR
jgi:hypothetical protein